jgi:hypothetical protein
MRQVLAPATVVLRPGAASAVELAFRPLLAGEAAAVLAVAAPGLGPLRFRLRLAAGPAPPLRALSFSAALGSAETQARPCARLLCAPQRVAGCAWGSLQATTCAVCRQWTCLACAACAWGMWSQVTAVIMGDRA